MKIERLMARQLKAQSHASWILAVAGFVMTVYAFHPGLMSVDSLTQYKQAVTGIYTDDHPPVMAFIWGMLNRMVPGPSGMLWLHAGMLWGGLALFARVLNKQGIRYAWLLVLAGFTPQVMGLLGVIWKDIGMATSLLMASAILSAAAKGVLDRRLGVALALVFITYATLVRFNGIAASLPLLLALVAVARPRYRTAKCLLLTIILGLVIGGVKAGIEYGLLDSKKMHLWQQIALHDLTGIRCQGGQVQIPDAFVIDEDICGGYDPYHADPLIFGPKAPLRRSLDPNALYQLRRTWLTSVAAEPTRYLHHRLRAFSGLLGVPTLPAHYMYLVQDGMEPNIFGIVSHDNPLRSTLYRIVGILSETWAFKGWFWCCLALLLALRSWSIKGLLTVDTLLPISALCYAVSYLPTTPAPNYRYLYWTVLATIVATLLAVLEKFEQRAAPETP